MSLRLSLPHHRTPPDGMAPFVIIAAKPQKVNKGSNLFQRVFFLGCQKGAQYIGCSGDGLYASTIKAMVRQFLKGQVSSIASQDAHHCVKGMVYQFENGTRVVHGGDSGLHHDHFLLNTVGLPKELWRRTDFASDTIILKICSVESIKRLVTDLPGEPQSTSTFTAISLFFVRCFLFAVDSKSCAPKQRIHLAWSSLIWLTSLYGVSQTTSSNFAYSVISVVFNATRADVVNLRYVMEEVSILYHATLPAIMSYPSP